MDVRRRATALLAGLVLVTMELTAPTPAAAAPADSDTLVFAGYWAGTWAVVRNGEVSVLAAPPIDWEPLPGDFSAAPGTDLFVYGSGDSPDGVLHVTPDGDAGATTSFTPKTVRGFYQPLVGDFDGNGLDDILWYGWGSDADSIWLFRPDGSHVSKTIRVDGDYSPFVVEATGDGRDDVFWYGFGPRPDHLWVFDEGATHTSRTMRVSGYYQPFVGHFRDTPGGTSQEQVLWYDWDGPSTMWTFGPGGTFSSRGFPGYRRSEPVVGDLLGTGRDVVFWYGFGGDQPEGLTSVAANGSPTLGPAATVNGHYMPVVGDFDGNGREDIAWTSEGRATFWTLEGIGTTYTQSRVSTGVPDTAPFVVRTDPADLRRPARRGPVTGDGR